MSERIWSVYQLAIFEWIKTGKGSAVVQARAGCAKTTTAVEGLRHIPYGSTSAYMAFAKANALDLQKKIPEGYDPRNVKTIHAHAFSAYKKAYSGATVDFNKTTKILRELVAKSDWLAPDEDAWPLISQAKKLVGLAKNTLTSFDDEGAMGDLLDSFQMTPEKREATISLAADAMRVSLANPSTLDFDDMVWIPVILNLPFFKYDFLFVDECQDLNAVQIEIVKRSIKPRGRILAIGDDRQAIYGFRGADASAMATLGQAIQAKTLPLSITYRCGKAIVAEVSGIVPDYRAHESNEEGEVRKDVPFAKAIDQLQAGDFLLSRSNAPLMRIAFELIAKGVRCNIAGRDIGEMLESFVVKSKATTIDQLLDYVDTWHSQQIAKATKRNPDADVQSIDDKAECIRALADNVKSISELVAAIGALFPDKIDDGSRVILGTVHKVKGLERDRVFMLRDTFLKTRKSRNGQVIQPSEEEWNIYYVACTRAKSLLVQVRGEPKQR